LPSCRLAVSLLLLDLHHGADLLFVQIEVVRLFGVLLHPPNQPPFIGVPQVEPARTANYFRHSAPPLFSGQGSGPQPVTAVHPQYHRPALRQPCREVATLKSSTVKTNLERCACDPPLRVYICGRPAIEAGAVAVREADLPGRQGRRLWVYLTLHRRGPVGRDELAEAIWGDDIPDAWDTTLNALASRLRRALAPLAEIAPGLAIRGEPGRYALALPAGSFVDWERARDAIHEADRLVFGGDPGGALAEARVAMEIAARGFLPGEDGPWIEGQRQTLREIRLRACERTVEAELARGRPDIAETEARLLLALDPLREASYRLLMRALAAGGNPAQAAAIYAACCRNLRERMGMRPSSETERVFREIAGHQ
jgi:DNA-binding SARP family transcriptional activator